MNNKSFISDTKNATLNPNMKEYADPFPQKMAITIDFIEKNGLTSKPKKTKNNYFSMSAVILRNRKKLYNANS